MWKASWVITGESRKYNAGAAAFARPVPAHPFDPINGERGWGAWELAARYSVTDPRLRRRQRRKPESLRPGAELVIHTACCASSCRGNYVNVDRENAAGTEIGQDFWDVALRSQIAF